MRPYIVKAIIKRDIKETIRNPQALIIVGLTVGINIFLGFAISKPLWVMTFAMSLVMIGFTLTSFIVTEEKDKKTLEALLVSPASYKEVLAGKLFLTFSITVLVCLSLIFSMHLEDVSMTHTISSVPIGAAVICLFGMVVGLICPSQVALSSIGTLLMLVLFLPELLAPTNEFVGHIARALPTHHVIQISSLGLEGFSTLILKHYVLLLISLSVTIYWAISFVKVSSQQERRSWDFSRRNKISTGVLFLTLCISSFVTTPDRGIYTASDSESIYRNSKYRVSLPLKSNKLELKAFSFQGKFIAKFLYEGSKDDYLYISMKKNKDNLTPEKDLAEVLEKLKDEGVLNLKSAPVKNISGIEIKKVGYKSKNEMEYFYIFSNEHYLYRVGIEVSDESENLKVLRDLASQSIELIELRN